MTLIGFILFLTGMMALILSVVGARITFLSWLDNWGALEGFLIRIAMIITGVVFIVLAQPKDDGRPV